MANSKKAYNAIAGLYEALMDVDYDLWADYVIKSIRQYAQGSTGVDIGCGSGAFTRRMKRAGLSVYGVDISEEMLAIAAQKTREEGLNITYVCQDVRAFRPMGKLDFITALTDCFNYVPAIDLKKTFKKLAAALKKGGVLMFDVSSEYKLMNVIGNNMFGEDGEDFSYLWFNRTFDGGVEMDISLFTRAEGGLYEKREEHHVQYAHKTELLTQLLQEAGFVVKRLEGHLGAEIEENTERFNIIAVKQ